MKLSYFQGSIYSLRRYRWLVIYDRRCSKHRTNSKKSENSENWKIRSSRIHPRKKYKYNFISRNIKRFTEGKLLEAIGWVKISLSWRKFAKFYLPTRIKSKFNHKTLYLKKNRSQQRVLKSFSFSFWALLETFQTLFFRRLTLLVSILALIDMTLKLP